MGLTPWSIIAKRMNKLEPNAKALYTPESIQKIFARAMNKLRRLAYRHPQLFDVMWSEIETPLAIIPSLANRVFPTSAHKCFYMQIFEPDTTIQDKLEDAAILEVPPMEAE